MNDAQFRTIVKKVDVSVRNISLSPAWLDVFKTGIERMIEEGRPSDLIVVTFRRMGWFVTWLHESEIHREPAELRKADLLGWMNSVRGTAATKGGYGRSVRWVFRTLNITGAISAMIIKYPQRVKREPLTDSEIAAIRIFIYGPRKHVTLFKIRRDKALFELLVSYAPRSSEIRNLTWKNYDPIRKRLVFLQKGGSFREVILTDKCAEAFREVQKFNYESVFNLGRMGLYGIMKGWLKQAGVVREKYVGSHLWRHTLATRAYKKSGDLEMTKQMLGHRFASTTEAYIHVSTREVRRLAESLSEE